MSDLDFEWPINSVLYRVVAWLIVILVGAFSLSAALAALEGYFQEASQISSVASALATILLTGITAWYAKLTRDSLRESQVQQKKPYIKWIIVNGIDPALECLDKHENKWSEDYEIRSLPYLKMTNLPESVVIDLAEENELAVKNWLEYKNAYEDYIQLYRDTLDELEAYISSSFGSTEFEEPITSIFGQTNQVEVSVSKYSRQFAIWTLTMYEPQIDKKSEEIKVDDIPQVAFLHLQDELIETRNGEMFGSKIEKLESNLDILRQLHPTTVKELEDARDGYLLDYDLLESEIEMTPSEVKNVK